MNRNNGFLIVGVLIVISLLLFGPAACVPKTPPATAIPSGSNSQTVVGSNGTSGIPVKCSTANGNVSMPAGSFTTPSQMKVTIACISSSEKAELDSKVKASTGSTSQIYGAIRLEPSPFKFLRNVTITIPLYKQLTAGKKINIYLYVPSSNPHDDFLKVSQATVDGGGWTATGVVDHFSIFLLIGDPAVIEEGQEEPPEPPTEPPAGFTCNDPLGCIAVAPDSPVRIAGLLDFSGQGEISAAALDGINSAMNEMGNIAGHWIEIVTLDGGCDAGMGASAANQFTADPQIAGVIGTICSASASDSRQILDKAGYVMVSPGNTRNAYTLSERLDGFFRVATPDLYQAHAMAEFAYNNLGARRMAIYLIEHDYGYSLADGFRERFESLGGQIVLSEVVPMGQSDMTAFMYNLEGSGVDAVYMPLFATEAGVFTAYVREFGMEFPLLGADSINNAEFLNIAGSAAENVYFSDTNPSVISNPSAYGYDAARLLLEAITRIAVPTEDGMLYIGRQALREALHDVSLNGQTGPVFCNGVGDCGHAQVAVYLFQGGQPNEVYRYSP